MGAFCRLGEQELILGAREAGVVGAAEQRSEGDRVVFPYGQLAGEVVSYWEMQESESETSQERERRCEVAPYGEHAVKLMLAQPLNMFERLELVVLHTARHEEQTNK